MERFDFEDEEEAPERRSLGLRPLDLVTALVLLLILALGAFMLYIFLRPDTPLNPLKSRVPTPFMWPTVTVTPLQMQPTWTPTAVFTTETATLAPTITLQPSPTTVSLLPPTKTPPPSPTPKAPYSASVSAIESAIIHPDLDCEWFGIGGSVVDSSGAPVLFMTLHLTGSLGGDPVEKLTVSGTALDYGQSGFEFTLGTTPVASNKLLHLQLLDQSGARLAEAVPIITYADCDKNLILVRFKKGG
jgi:hypothetical protein